MDTESNKVRPVVNEDRFSSLPDELIHQILSCLDTKFAVQTSILSSRWKHIWKSMPWLDFSSREFHTLHAFSKFVTHVLSHRNHQVEVTSLKLYFNGAARQAFVRKVANYVLSHNDQEPTVSRCPKKNHEFPPCFFSSRTLEQLPISFHMFAPCVTPITPWDFPALTILSLFDTMLCDDGRESFEPFSKCVNLTNLILRRVIVHAKVFDIITPRVTKLTLIDCEHSQIANVIAPQLERLTVIDSSINYMKAPLRLSYLFYGGDQHPQWFKDCFQSLNEVSVSLCIYGKTKPYKEKAARETINMLQELHSARCLTLNMDIVECISSFPDLISHHPSPFSNLISLTINSNLRDRLDAHKLKMTTEARNFLLENSPSATLIMDLPKPPPTKAMKAKLAREKRAKLIAEIQTRMKTMQTSLDQENLRYIERKQAEEEMKTALEHLMTELQILTDKRRMQNELGKTPQIEELSQIKVLISAKLREIADMCIQEYDKALTFYTKMTDIISLLVALRKLTQQMAEIEACHSSQREETGTLLTRLLLTSKGMLSYVKQKTEAFKKYKSDNISTSQDTSLSAVIPTPSSTGINPMPCIIDSGLLKIVLAHQVDTNFMKLELSSLGLDFI